MTAASTDSGSGRKAQRAPRAAERGATPGAVEGLCHGPPALGWVARLGRSGAMASAQGSAWRCGGDTDGGQRAVRRVARRHLLAHGPGSDKEWVV